MYSFPNTGNNVSYIGTNQGYFPSVIGMTGGNIQQQPTKRNPMLLHSYSTSDASLGEYKYTVNIGQHSIKITGDSCDLVRVR